ncbi:MAG: hypothetical protein CM1200mP14_09750 [Gammaproteobacteria bacterium]|nr:MAG: hypothetical protein CM1200mP14_09750 [Gammaproteobacteria bacterium]
MRELLKARLGRGIAFKITHAARRFEGSIRSGLTGWWIGEPDLVVEFEQPVHVRFRQDWQPTFNIPVPDGAHTEAKWISKAELRPGGPGFTI